MLYLLNSQILFSIEISFVIQKTTSRAYCPFEIKNKMTMNSHKLNMNFQDNTWNILLLVLLYNLSKGIFLVNLFFTIHLLMVNLQLKCPKK